MASLAHTVAPAGLTLMATGGALLLQATRRPTSTRETQRPAAKEYLDIFRPAMPTITILASGSPKGSHGERLSALRWGL